MNDWRFAKAAGLLATVSTLAMVAQPIAANAQSAPSGYGQDGGYGQNGGYGQGGADQYRYDSNGYDRNGAPAPEGQDRQGPPPGDQYAQSAPPPPSQYGAPSQGQYAPQNGGGGDDNSRLYQQSLSDYQRSLADYHQRYAQGYGQPYAAQN